LQVRSALQLGPLQFALDDRLLSPLCSVGSEAITPLLEASLNQDIYLIEACPLVAVGVAVVTQTLADVGYTYLNPRLRFEAIF